MNLPLTSIRIKPGRRAVDDSKVRELADSMKTVGLINPVTVSADYTLITGAHRVAAARLLGWTEIAASIAELDELHAELAEIDENLMRNELHYIDRGNAIKRRDELLKAAGLRRNEGRYPNTANSAGLKTTADISAELGVSERTLQVEKQLATDILPEVQDAIKAADLPKRDALKIARMEPERQKQIAEKLSSGSKSVMDATRLVKRDEVHGTPELKGKHRVIYADPPWPYALTLSDNYGGAVNHYPSMTVEEIKLLPVKDIADDNCVLFLWATSPLLPAGLEVLNAWGFRYTASFVWDKVKHNVGNYNSVRHEFLLVGVKGSCLPEVGKLYDSVVSEERTEHSVKPETFRGIIESLYPTGKKIELFARAQRDGWTAWGNQA